MHLGGLFDVIRYVRAFECEHVEGVVAEYHVMLPFGMAFLDLF